MVVQDNTQHVTNLGATVEKFPVFSAVPLPKPHLKSVVYGPSKPHDPVITMVPSLLQKVLTSIPNCLLK